MQQAVTRQALELGQIASIQKSLDFNAVTCGKIVVSLVKVEQCGYWLVLSCSEECHE